MNPGFWRGKRVLVTGHTGFKGAWLCLWLQQLGAKPVGYALAAPTRPSLFVLARVEQGMVSITGDVRDGESLARVVREHRPQIVFHLAAQSLVRPSYEDPVGTYATNVMGTVNLLEAVRQGKGVKALVNVTSDKCYENREWLWPYRESEPMGGADPYSSSKGCAELVTAAYRRSFFGASGARSAPTAIATARAGNVIGGGDWARDRLVPDIMQAVLAGNSVKLRNPGAVRPWQHVLDPLHGYLVLAERLHEEGAGFAESWNFGPDAEASREVAWVTERLTQLWGGKARWSRERGPQPHEAGMLKLDSSKARVRLGWAPRVALDAALEWVVEWYRAYAAKQNLRVVVERQIQRFEEITA